MVKFGKLYRDLQFKEFLGNYIDYKKLKQKIKQIKESLPAISPTISMNSFSNKTTKFNLQTSFQDDVYIPNSSKLSFADDKYNEKIKEFKNLLDQEFQKCFQFFRKIKINLHNKLNTHLYTQTNYSSYNEEEIIKEIDKLRLTIYLAKCLNVFINDNMMAIKKILKKFDKKFNILFGNLGPKYILDNLCKENSELEYLLQFKIIDEACCIIEGNMNLLKENYLELNNGRKIKKEEDQFFIKYNETWGYLIDIDELIYFKIQYKEWFYYIKKNSIFKKKSDLFKNLMFNPILFSPYHKDDIMDKLLSRKDQIKEIKNIQIPLSFSNQINILLIFVQTFFCNTLISGIYPLQFIYVEDIETLWDKKYNLTEYSFLIISSTYICSYFSIMIYHIFGTKRIKLSYIISNIFFLVGSICYMISYNSNKDENFVFAFLITARIFIGFGANPLMGKKYILSFAPNYFLPYISKIYVLVSILGHSMGPFFVFIFFAISEGKDEVELFNNIFYSKYNCIGWYGMVISIILILIDILLFKSPTSKGFRKLKTKNPEQEKYLYENKKEDFLVEDNEDTEDKEFYKLQKEMTIKNYIKNEENDNITNKSSKESIIKPIINQQKSEEGQKNEKNIDIESITTSENRSLGKSVSFQKKENYSSLISMEYNKNPLLLKEEEKDGINLFGEGGGCFSNINMIPRTIEDLIRKEKKTFSYLNKNLLIILIILFFCNVVKENFIGYSSYCLYNKRKEKEHWIIFTPTYLCLSISISYFLELFSMLFILPLYRINTKLKKILVVLMSITIALMIPICFDIPLLIYFIIISIVILISAIIEVLSSAYLAYLTPPDWKISHINAGSLPFYIINIAKLFGCIICFCSIAEIYDFVHHLNNFVILLITALGYGISGFYILRSKNFRIKAICRIMRKAEIDSFNFH